jgi:hypothetical protein
MGVEIDEVYTTCERDENACRVLVGKHGRDLLGNVVLDERIILLKRIFDIEYGGVN